MPPRSPDTEASDLAACRAMLRADHAVLTRRRDCCLVPCAIRRSRCTRSAVSRTIRSTAIAGDAGGLAWLRERLALVYAGQPIAQPADRALARIVARFGIPRALPEALLEGFAWDAEGRRYDDLAALRAYAVRVAGTVGAMMAVLMGVRDPARLAAAIDLGVAMQLSNIARDVGEDARAGRLYLPLRWLAEAGIDPELFLAAPHTRSGPGPRGATRAGCGR